MSVKLTLSAVLKVVDVFTGKAVEETRMLYSGKDGKLVDKGDGIYALVNWSGNRIQFSLQKAGYHPVDVVLEKQTEGVLYKAITMRKKRSDTSFVECSFPKRKKLSGPVLFGFQSRGTARRVIKDAPKGSLLIKLSGSVNLDEEYRNILLQDEKHVYTIIGYEDMEKAYTLDQPLKHKVEMGSMLSVLQDGMVEDNTFTAEYVPSARREEKIDRMVAVFQGKFYEAEIEEHNGIQKAVFKEW